MIVPPGAGMVPLPGTTSSADAELGGTIVADRTTAFEIVDIDDALVGAGELQDRVVRSNGTGLVHLYFRLPRVSLPGPWIGFVSRSRFPDDQDLDVDFRIDGSGDLPPHQVTRWGPGLVSFVFQAPTGDADTRFVYVKTPAASFDESGYLSLAAYMPGGPYTRQVSLPAFQHG